jgi:zinc transport system substrate-binding protein
VRAIAEELGKADSAHAIAYRKRATELDASLAALDKETEARTKALSSRGLVTLHGDFQYFAERYKLEIDAAPARALAPQAKVPLVLDPLGGGSETDSYEKLIRYDVAQLEKHLRAP